ncbi:MAG: RNA polymerase sigma factor [Verrucomicrobia bacterium]|nr:RNA polymerase sigma factor [Verrucomicrobiota bacterium]
MDDAIAKLEHLYRDMAPALLAYFRRQPTLAGAAEDLLQDTFVRAIRGFDRLQASVSPRAYLFGIARHVSLDALRTRRPMEELMAEPAAPPAAPEDARLEPMRAAIAKLPEPQRETLLLKLNHELSYEEIAELLGIPVGTVRSRLHHALNHLRATLNPPLSPPPGDSPRP